MGRGSWFGGSAHSDGLGCGPFGNKLSAEGQTCLHLVAVQGWDLVHRNLALEGALDFQQDQGVVKGLEVTVGAASYFAVKRVSLGKIEGDCVPNHLGVVLPLNIGSSEWLEELAPSTSHVVAQVWRVKLLIQQACWGVKGGSPCQGCYLGSTDGVFPGFDLSCTSLFQPCLVLLQEGFESCHASRHGRSCQRGMFLQLGSLCRLTFLHQPDDNKGTNDIPLQTESRNACCN